MLQPIGSNRLTSLLLPRRARTLGLRRGAAFWMEVLACQWLASVYRKGAAHEPRFRVPSVRHPWPRLFLSSISWFPWPWLEIRKLFVRREKLSRTDVFGSWQLFCRFHSWESLLSDSLKGDANRGRKTKKTNNAQ